MPFCACKRDLFLYLLVLITLCFIQTLRPSVLTAQGFSIDPSISISQEYSDNINQEQEKLSDFTTRIMPQLVLRHDARHWDFSLQYAFEYLYYARENKRRSGGFTQDDTRHTLSARGLANLVPNLFYLDVRNDYRRVDLNLVRSSEVLVEPEAPVEQEPVPVVFPGDEILVPQYEEVTSRERETSDRNEFAISPFIELRPSPRSSLRTGYRYRNIWYKEDDVRDVDIHEIFLRGGYDLTARITLDAGYTGTWRRNEDDGREVVITADRTFVSANEVINGMTIHEAGAEEVFLEELRQERSRQGREDRHTIYGGASYAYGPGSRIHGDYGTTWRRYQDQNTTTNPYWNIGIRHAFPTMIATLTSGVAYLEDPLRDTSRRQINHTASLARPYPRGNMRLFASSIDYKDPDDTRYSVGFALQHKLTRLLTGTVGVTYNRRKEERIIIVDSVRESIENKVDEWRLGLGLIRPLGRNFTASLNYFYIDSSSNIPLSDDNFRENRVILMLSKSF
ncbi:porin family protein [Desulfonatronum parangueonense]